MLGRSMVKPFFPFETIEPNHHRYPHHPSRSPVVPTASTASNQNASLTTYTRRALGGIGCKTAALLALTSPWIHDLGRSVNQSIALPVPSNDDFTVTPSGLRLLDLKVGRGGQVHPHAGAVVVVDWAGYTKGYQGKRIGNTTIPNGQDEPFRFRIGGGEAIRAFEEAVEGMHVGGVRRIEIPGSHPELGYPLDRNQRFVSGHYRLGPQPADLGGQRALDFVLDNPTLQDFNRTLLFDIKLLSVR